MLHADARCPHVPWPLGRCTNDTSKISDLGLASDHLIRLFTRYVVIGVYVGLSTIAGFVWWFIYFPEVCT